MADDSASDTEDEDDVTGMDVAPSTSSQSSGM